MQLSNSDFHSDKTPHTLRIPNLDFVAIMYALSLDPKKKLNHLYSTPWWQFHQLGLKILLTFYNMTLPPPDHWIQTIYAYLE